ncbi:MULTISPECIES: GNAT family N-acetyltransferase [unclassified Rhodococcus (in: high G+C Gram-positive bacteria)]|uniref:GNAT family N-acetyltransferase n=1 Tax=unclassified Rhodococcus (in: high G+C Gram-positive bacteria) TaxID=192944 RepID=UPI001F20BD15|nr:MULTISPECIES: GNAT family N-acetyltransferase [unclassified Rhodococcus (in: high G+C Gram-positive bacteria)]MDQ1182842.1 ribosomal protein S18 acetylase RimI-like enzyme [Rhodococcus sp. SORGH_AS_0301]MDQ1199926.1 ribosomal protein S18 acetylase RimI-like enzyme [Rhodococcus sp. SORGH_AS_0303]
MQCDDRVPVIPTLPDAHPLDDPIRSSLVGAHSRFAEWRGRIARYHPEVAGFFGHPEDMTAEDWADLGALLPVGEQAALRGDGITPPAGWRVLDRIGLLQFDGSALVVEPEPAAQVLTADDVPEMLDLVHRTRPGPFRSRTVEMGTYLGVRDGSRLVAMAGERMHPDGWTEISAVCTDPEYRGQGLATRLIRAVGYGIRERGEVPFLHTSVTNTRAVALYDTLGFVLRRQTTLTIAEVA